MLICKMIDVEVNDENHNIPLIAHIWKIVIYLSSGTLIGFLRRTNRNWQLLRMCQALLGTKGVHL